MTSEPDTNPGRRPPTIELKATEVDDPAVAAQSGGGGPADTPPPKSSGPTPSDPQPNAAAAGRVKSYAVSAIVGAAAMAAIAAGLWFVGVLPSRQAAPSGAATAPETAAAPQPASNAEQDVSARLDKIERTIQAQRNQPALANRVAAAEAQTKALTDSLAALNRRVDAIVATSQSAAKAADAAQAATQAVNQAASRTSVQQSDLDALGGRIAALEKAVKTLSENAARPAQGADDQAARLTIAAEVLRAAVERGAPYPAELAAVQSFGVAQDAFAPLAPFAANGVPSAAALAHQLVALTPDLQRAAEPSSDESTFLGRLEAHAQQLVRITPVEAPAGNEPSAVVARIEVDAAHADIAAALADIDALPDSAKPLAADWIAKAKAREAARAAARQIAAAALAGLSKPASQ